MQIDNISAVGNNDNLLLDMNKVQQRITQIEDRFNIKHFAPQNVVDFQQTLTKQLKNETDGSENINTKKNITGRAANSSSTREESAPGAIADLIQKSAAKYGIDARLLSAVAEAESNYHPDAVSSAGAVGVMQLMPDTAAALGVADPYDARQNIDGGAKYLKELLNDFGGNVRDAVAAYNAGPQAVKEYNGVPPYGETQNYVDHVLDLYQ